MASFTAGEFRQIADAFEPNGVVARIHNGIGEREIFARDIVAMLRQAAASLERGKCEYEYAARYFYPSGVIATAYIFDNLTDAKLFSVSRDGAKKIICRREVGEWEEVSDVLQ